MKIIEATDLHKSYSDKGVDIHILKGAAIEINSGDLVCITGQSGCGKSTLLHILGLLDSADRGTVLFKGEKVSSQHPTAAEIRNLHIGFVFQFHYLIEDLTAVENVAVPMMIAGKSASESLKQAGNILKNLDMTHRLSHYPSELSGGEQQRVALARAMINQPDIILADEPTGNLDPDHSSDVWNLIHEMNRNTGQTFVIVTHEPGWADTADRKLVLTDGKLT